MKDVTGSLPDLLDFLPVIRNSKGNTIGIIGNGRIAHKRQIPAYLHAGLTVAAVADIDAEARENAKRDYGIPDVYADYRELLERNDIAIIDICTNTFPRKQITLDALAAGRQVLSEKPFARTFEDAREIVQTAENNGVKLAIHQPTRWYYPVSVTRELIRKGYLGTVFYIELRLHGDQDTAYYNDPVTRWHTDLTDHIFVEWGAHYYDLARWFAGGETPEMVFAAGTRTGNEHFNSKMAVASTASFSSGIRASLSLNQATRFAGLPYSGMTFRIEGTEGAAAGDMVSSLSFMSRKEGGIKADFDWSASLPKEEDPHNYLWNASIRDGHLWPMAELINALAENREPLNSGKDNIETVCTYLAAMESDRINMPVSPQKMKQLRET